ncbi:hypothetical protein SVAN01_00245 [Stagonosporopsis vannaccii]|nr:hypothetical protein SVAN01_00245 [Stagonosporopsis vannaccii]
MKPHLNLGEVWALLGLARNAPSVCQRPHSKPPPCCLQDTCGLPWPTRVSSMATRAQSVRLVSRLTTGLCSE